MIGRTLRTLEEAMQSGLGKRYQISWIELDSSILGSPQVRKRVYIIGLRKDLGEMPDLGTLLEQRPRFPFIAIEELLDEAGRSELTLNANQERNIRSSMRSRQPSFKDGMRRVGNAYTCKGGNVGQGYHAHGLVPTLTKVWARFLPIYFPAQGEVLPSDIDDRDFEPNHLYGSGTIRRASVREAMRLQGFPEEFRPHQNSRVAYEHAGNAVNAWVIREIADLLLPVI